MSTRHHYALIWMTLFSNPRSLRANATAADAVDCAIRVCPRPIAARPAVHSPGRLTPVLDLPYEDVTSVTLLDRIQAFASCQGSRCFARLRGVQGGLAARVTHCKSK